MGPTSRRNLLKMMAAAPIGVGAAASTRFAEGRSAPEKPSDVVKLFGDSLALSPAESVAVLDTILDERGIEADYYSRGGVVEELETTMAKALGKERAIYFRPVRSPITLLSGPWRAIAFACWSRKRATSTTTRAIACSS